MASNHYALILAGGSGTRFWPLSRNARPKQLLALFDQSTLLEQTLTRLHGIVPPENTLVLTNVEQEAAVREIVGHVVPPENISAEPAKRDTGPAIALGIGCVARRDPEATMAVLPADHLIQDVDEFRRVLRSAIAAASESEALGTIGIRPTWACPSYGYIERGERTRVTGVEPDIPLYNVIKFHEKPGHADAREFVDSGRYSWNAGMFIWRVPVVVRQLSNHFPELANFIQEVRDTGDLPALLAERFPQLTSISIDYALMEHAKPVLNLEATFDWDDVGSWISVAKYFRGDKDGNRANGEVTPLESSNNIVYTQDSAHVGLLGVHDLIVVQTGDALLIADRKQADAIKELVDKLPPALR